LRLPIGKYARSEFHHPFGRPPGGRCIDSWRVQRDDSQATTSFICHPEYSEGSQRYNDLACSNLNEKRYYECQ